MGLDVWCFVLLCCEFGFAGVHLFVVGCWLGACVVGRFPGFVYGWVCWCGFGCFVLFACLVDFGGLDLLGFGWCWLVTWLRFCLSWLVCWFSTPDWCGWLAIDCAGGLVVCYRFVCLFVLVVGYLIDW